MPKQSAQPQTGQLIYEEKIRYDDEGAPVEMQHTSVRFVSTGHERKRRCTRRRVGNVVHPARMPHINVSIGASAQEGRAAELHIDHKTTERLLRYNSENKPYIERVLKSPELRHQSLIEHLVPLTKRVSEVLDKHKISGGVVALEDDSAVMRYSVQIPVEEYWGIEREVFLGVNLVDIIEAQGCLMSTLDDSSELPPHEHE